MAGLCCRRARPRSSRLLASGPSVLGATGCRSLAWYQPYLARLRHSWKASARIGERGAVGRAAPAVVARQARQEDCDVAVRRPARLGLGPGRAPQPPRPARGRRRPARPRPRAGRGPRGRRRAPSPRPARRASRRSARRGVARVAWASRRGAARGRRRAPRVERARTPPPRPGRASRRTLRTCWNACARRGPSPAARPAGLVEGRQGLASLRPTRRRTFVQTVRRARRQDMDDLSGRVALGWLPRPGGAPNTPTPTTK
jgi:hypothetical protein